MLRIARGGAIAQRESIRMVGEKFEAAFEAQAVAAASILAGHPEQAFGVAASAYERRVRANRRRLAPS